MAPLLGYWDMRGFAESIRFLLRHVGVEFEDKRYPFGEGGKYDPQEWLADKKNMGFDFPNVPYYIDEDVKLTQSIVIMRYLGRKHGLYPTNETDLLAAETIEQISRDIFGAMVAVVYHSKQPFTPEVKKSLDESLYELFRQVSNCLGDKDYFAGNKLCYADFLIYEAVDEASYIATDALAKFPNLGRFVKRIESLPAIAKYIKSDQYTIWPLFRPFAAYGGSGPIPKRTL